MLISQRCLCFIRAGDRVLLIHRRKPPNAGQWDGVGGKMEPGEDPYAACIREVREETGLQIHDPVLRVLLVIHVRPTDALWIIYVFTAPAPATETVASEEGDLDWVEVDRVAERPVPPDVPLMLPFLFADDHIVIIREEMASEDGGSMTAMEVLSR